MEGGGVKGLELEMAYEVSLSIYESATVALSMPLFHTVSLFMCRH